MTNYLKNITLLILTGVISVSVAACSSVPTPDDSADQATRVIAPKTDAQKQKLYDYLLGERGIDIIKIGETRTIVISSDQLFTADSANFNPVYARYIKIIAQLINAYDTTSVAVTAYTSQSGDAAQALTERQAQKVLTYLQKSGASTRLIYAKGYGDAYPVALSKTENSANRRVEIKFQFHPQEGGNSL